MENCGTTYTLTHITLLALLIALVMKLSIKKAAKSQVAESKTINNFIWLLYRPYFKLRHWFSWRVLITTCLEVYLEVCLGAMAVLIKWPWTDSWNDRLNCIYASFYGFLLIFFPGYMTYFYYKNYNHLDQV